MGWKEQCVAVMPCLNEAGSLPELIPAVRNFIPNVVVVDDGSLDQTAAVAVEAGTRVLRNEVSEGKGAALRRGFECARAEGFAWGLAMDGDGQHAAEDIAGFLRVAEESSARLVVGNRMQDAREMPLVRRVVNRWMSARLSKFCGMQLPDSQCGFRLVNLDAWGEFCWRARHFEIESEILVRFARAGYGIEFVPIQTRYRGESSRIRAWRDTVRWLRWWREIRKEYQRASAQSYGEFVGHPAT